MGVKLNINKVKHGAIELGTWKVIDSVYVNCSTKLKCKCIRHGHINYISWNNIKQNKGCPTCNKMYNKNRLDFNIIKKSFKKEGYTLLTKKYINNVQKLKYICPKGHRHSITWRNWRQGKRCFYCFGSAKLTIEFIKQEFEKEGYQFLTMEYKNSKQSLEYICPNGHKHRIKWGDWKNGVRCPYCSGHSSVGLDLNNVKDSFENEGYVILSNIDSSITARTKLRVKCTKGHVFNTIWARWKQGQRCPKCSNNVSRWEEEIKEFIKSLNIYFVSNDRTQIVNPKTSRSLELDIWFPQLNKAIECNGIYWHSKSEKKLIDNVKRNICKEMCIDLFVITDDQWYSDIDQSMLKISNFLDCS